MALKFLKEKSEVLQDLVRDSKIYLDGFRGDFEDLAKKIIDEKRPVILQLRQIFSALEGWNHEGIKSSFEKFTNSSGLKIKDFGPVLRIALTFSSSSSGGVLDVVEALGKEEVLARIDNVL